MIGVIQDPLADRPFDWSYKGFARAWEGLTASQIAATETSLFDGTILLPAAILKRSVVEANRAWMRDFLAVSGAALAPHGKTTMAPALFRQQAEDGAWAITAATAHHARLYRRFGVSRILMANQLLGTEEVDWVLSELETDPNFDFYCLVDSIDGVDQLAARADFRRASRPLKVLVEMGRPGGRCGARNVVEGLKVARAAAARKPYLALVGVETFEGLGPEASDGPGRAQSMLDRTVDLASACVGEALFSGSEILLSAGGSAFFDLAAKTLASADLSGRTRVVLRSGCYISHDDGTYGRLFEALRRRIPDANQLGPGLAGALQVWARIQSIPEPGLIVCAFGRRDVGTETDMPKAVNWARPGDSVPRPAPAGLVTAAMFDQHAVLSAPLSHDLRIGDFIGFGVSHPCTTFDKWRTLLVVDDRYIVRDVLRTYF